MMEKSITIKLENGLEARPVALLVQVASQYDSTIYLQCADKKVNAKSIMGMMSLSLSEGEEVTIFTEGEDEEKAAEGIKTFFMTSK